MSSPDFLFGSKKCVRIYRYIELEMIAEDCQNDRMMLDESIEKVSKDLEEVIGERDYMDDSLLDFQEVLDRPRYQEYASKDLGEFIDDSEYDDEYSLDNKISDIDEEEAYKLACHYFNSKEHKDKIRLEKLKLLSKENKRKNPPDWLSDIPLDQRESFKSLYTLQHIARSYFGCETAIFQPE